MSHPCMLALGFPVATPLRSASLFWDVLRWWSSSHTEAGLRYSFGERRLRGISPAPSRRGPLHRSWTLGDPSRTVGVEGAEAVSDGALYRSMYAALFVALSRRTRVAASDGPSRSQRCPPPQDAIRPGGTKAAIRTRQSEDLLRVARPGRADRRHRARRRAYCSSTSTSVGGGGASPGRTR